jgi:uncharacterized protein (UPF0297 family)
MKNNLKILKNNLKNRRSYEVNTRLGGGLLMAENQFDKTIMFKAEPEDVAAREILEAVYQALKEKGYNPINQIVGYLLSGDPAYITSHNNARSLIRKLERDDLLEELVKNYLKQE